jgi:hypothetical protein
MASGGSWRKISIFIRRATHVLGGRRLDTERRDVRISRMLGAARRMAATLVSAQRGN